MNEGLLLSAAVSDKPFRDSNGTPMTDVSEFADVIDYIGSLFLALPVSLFSDRVTQRL
jgi:hypothetical protein